MTNYECMMNISIEELAKILAKQKCACDFCVRPLHCKAEKCYIGCLEWLKSEVDDGET